MLRHDFREQGIMRKAQPTMIREYVVDVEWDEEARVWVATSVDVPGLVTEAVSLDLLLERVRAVTPDLLADNAAHLAADMESEARIDMRVHRSFGRPAAHAH
jgi:hypothetical protein